MITPITSKLFVDGYKHPKYRVKDRIFYSKFKAIKYCKEVKWEWPTFEVWDKPKNFSRPRISFEQSVKRQCEIISDTCDKVRLFYSGGRDSGLILDSMLKYKGKIDEIAVYRRYPGKIDNLTNEWDIFDMTTVLNNILKKYDRNVPVKMYDILPQHFNYYSKNPKAFYDGYFSGLGMFRNSVHTVAEIYPELLENNFVNIYGECKPNVTEDKKFYWTDLSFNLAHNDPYTLFFFVDDRNTDLAVNMAYAIHHLQEQKKFTEKTMKEYLNFPKNGSPLDNDWTAPNKLLNVPRRWIVEKKDILAIANALQTEMGEESYLNFVALYEDTEKNYKKFFKDGSIYVDWIGSISEIHTLVD